MTNLLEIENPRETALKLAAMPTRDRVREVKKLYGRPGMRKVKAILSSMRGQGKLRAD